MIIGPLDTSSLNWEKISLKRGDFLTRAGTVEQYMYFVENGAVRAFIIEEEEELTIRFGYKDSLMTSIDSYFSGQPTEIFIQAIRKADLFRVSKKEFEDFIDKDLTKLQLYRIMLQELIVSFLDRERDLLTKSPSERLKRILARSPQLFQEVPHKYIASYLRMSPETLSRLLKS